MPFWDWDSRDWDWDWDWDSRSEFQLEFHGHLGLCPWMSELGFSSPFQIFLFSQYWKIPEFPHKNKFLPKSWDPLGIQAGNAELELNALYGVLGLIFILFIPPFPLYPENPKPCCSHPEFGAGIPRNVKLWKLREAPEGFLVGFIPGNGRKKVLWDNLGIPHPFS